MSHNDTEQLQYQVFCEMDELVANRLSDEYVEDLPSRGLHEETAAECDAILNQYKEELQDANNNREKILSAIKKVTLAFNDFDRKYQYFRMLHCYMFLGELIPGSELTYAKAIRQIILQRAADAGVGNGEDDLTEKWRLW